VKLCLCSSVHWTGNNCYVLFQKAFLYGELLLNEMWRKYVSGSSTTKNELTETLVDLFLKLQRFDLLYCFSKYMVATTAKTTLMSRSSAVTEILRHSILFENFINYQVTFRLIQFLQIQIQIFIDTLAAESRITCYEQKCLKATDMTHNKSIGTDTHTYTDIY